MQSDESGDTMPIETPSDAMSSVLTDERTAAKKWFDKSKFEYGNPWSAAANSFIADMLVAVEKYRERNTENGTLSVSLDQAREMLPGYQSAEERLANHAAVSSAALKLRNAVYADALQRGPTDEKAIVEFLAGSPGAGKSLAS